MAQVAGLDMSGFSYPKTLYFKYLLSDTGLDNKGVKTERKPFYEKDLNILFIDDNFDKGWEECLKGVFRNNIVKKGEIVIKSSFILEENLAKNIANDKYDLIILDYYLQDGEKGINLLKKIKEKNPVVPVIMFTASNKAWNMDELYEAGADGYYVKEHPDTEHDAKFSIENFEGFHKTIKHCLEKGTLLRGYSRKIKEIESFDFIKNNSGQKNKERITERLTMFLGLLKKDFEQTKFDKNTFFYSEWELSFLTLWSTLNEIQEVHFEKTNNFIEFSFTDLNNLLRRESRHPGRGRFIPRHLLNWKIKNSQDYFIAYRPEFDSKGQPKLKNDIYYNLTRYSKIFRDTSSISGLKIEEEYLLLSDDKWKYEKNLSIQIAFLIFKLSPMKTLDRDEMNRNLLFLNDTVRNKLYLTHGEDSTSLNFAFEYKDQRYSDKDWETHIEQLFEIVHFLCTGEKCIWDKPEESSPEVVL